jgi:UDP-2,3-diacylglucosamine hydrolase
VARSLFISDLHLHPSRPATVRALGEFLASSTDCQRLFILGDLFDAWVGDDDDAALARDIATMLRAFSDAGPQLYLMRGNRDFLLGEDYCSEIGATHLADPSVIDIEGTPTLLMHGDSLCTDDADYQAFRLQARHPDWQAAMLSKPLDERREIAAHIRSISKEANSNKAEDIMDVNLAAVAQEMRTAGVRQMIHGHTHRPAEHQQAEGSRWVLGDWNDKGWYIESSTAGLNLIEFNINQ